MYGKISEANRMLGFLTLWRSSWNELGSMQNGMASVMHIAKCILGKIYYFSMHNGMICVANFYFPVSLKHDYRLATTKITFLQKITSNKI